MSDWDTERVQVLGVPMRVHSFAWSWDGQCEFPTHRFSFPKSHSCIPGARYSDRILAAELDGESAQLMLPLLRCALMLPLASCTNLALDSGTAHARCAWPLPRYSRGRSCPL